MILDKKKILSSLALAGILTVGVFGANVNAQTANEYLKPVGVYKKLVERKTVVPYVLKEKNTPVTVADIQAEFVNLELVNGIAVTDVNMAVKTGDTFTANGIEYTVVVYGDVNKDGKISTKDATLIQKIVVGKAEGIDSIQMEAADVNNNGNVTTKDALALQKYIVGKTDIVIDELPPIEDVTAPVLSGVTDGEERFVNLNDTTFTLPTVTAIDDFDGEVAVTVIGNVNVEEEGKYEVIYSATDREGNVATATLTVIVDGTAPKADVRYSTTVPTKDGVTVTIISDEEIQALEGWILSEDKMSMTKVYEDNTVVDGEDIVVSDIVGNTESVKVVVTGIDKVKPTAGNATYSTSDATKGTVTVTIVADEKIQPVEEWELSDDQVTLTKVFEDNRAETVTIVDLAGNTIETPVEVTVNNIYNGLPIITGMFTQEEQSVYVSLTDTVKLPTVTATDIKGADVTVVTTIKQEVNGVEQDYTGTELVLSAPTKYIITYTATDIAENVVTIQRVINVIAE